MSQWVLSDGVAVGYSEWPWDRLYTPVVGCFVNGRLRAHAVCNVEPLTVGLRGPSIRCWFRLELEGRMLQQLDDGDPSVRLIRMEDGQPVERAGPARAHTRKRKVEELLSLSFGKPAPLNGFPAFLGAPADFKLDVLFLDLFRRMPDMKARETLLLELRDGADIIAIRDRTLASEEFLEQELSIADGVGSMLTSPLWNKFVCYPCPAGKIRPVRHLALTEFEGLSGEDFVASLYGMLFSRKVDPVGAAHYSHMAEAQGRKAVITELSREAAHRGVYVVADSPT